MGGFRVCIYMGLDPVIVFSSPQNNLLYQFPIIVSPSIHLDQLTASVHAPRVFFFFFWRDRRLSSAHTQSVTNRLTLT